MIVIIIITITLFKPLCIFFCCHMCVYQFSLFLLNHLINKNVVLMITIIIIGLIISLIILSGFVGLAFLVLISIYISKHKRRKYIEIPNYESASIDSTCFVYIYIYICMFLYVYVCGVMYIWCFTSIYICLWTEIQFDSSITKIDEGTNITTTLSSSSSLLLLSLTP